MHIRYFGGKSKIANDVSAYINNLITKGIDQCNISEENNESQAKSLTTLIPPHTHYVEPFCGACNVASKIHIKNKILNDKNPYLISMFKALQNGWIPPQEVSEEEYKYAKINQDKEPHIAGFVGFACSFAGKFWGGYARDNRGGNYALRGHNSILKKMETLMDADFMCKDFTELEFENCIIYCDPPYKDTTPYYKKILGEFPYDVFIEWVHNQSKNNIVLVSEYKHNVPKNANIVLEIPSKTSIRDKNNSVIETIEVLYSFNKIAK
jgi:DNA adenine methylase